jgi:hypothetical protein
MALNVGQTQRRSTYRYQVLFSRLADSAARWWKCVFSGYVGFDAVQVCSEKYWANELATHAIRQLHVYTIGAEGLSLTSRARDNAPDLYSRSSRFESWSVHRISRLRFFAVSSGPPRKCRYSTSNQVTAASFYNHSNSLIIIPFHTI